ncbi:MAG: carboxypeptidase-like regulatory domain-containing protein [Candidatus Eisenbacteria bacterium]
MWRSVGMLAVLALVPWLLLDLIGCDGEHAPTQYTPTPEPFEVADTVSVSLELAPGAAYTDSAAGLAFYFPGGASGDLTYGALISAPVRRFEGGRGLYIHYGGGEEVWLTVPAEAGDFTVLLGYGSPFGSWNISASQHWFALPVVDTLKSGETDSLRIQLGQPALLGCETAWAYWLLTLPGDSEEGARFAASIEQARGYIATWLDSLDTTTRSSCLQRIAGDLPPAFYPDGNYYTGFTRPCAGDAPRPLARIGISPGASPQTIAHQIGHYCMHLLAGDAAYLALEELSPLEAGIGAFHALREGPIEDYAHYHEYLLTGSIEGAGDPAAPAGFFGPVAPAPGRIDLPSIEGYGVLLLHALTQRDSTVNSLTGGRVGVPIVGWSYAELAAHVLSLAPPSMTDLWEAVDGHLRASGRGDLLPPLAAATGWCYTASGTVSDASGFGVSGARIWNILERDGRRYASSENPVLTQEGGDFVLSTLYPGKSVVRVEAPADTFEFEITFPQGGFTDQERDLGTVAAWSTLERLGNVGVTIRLQFAAHPDSATILDCFFYCARVPGVTYGRDRLYLAHPVVLPCAGPGDDPARCWTIDSLAAAYSLETGLVSELRVDIHNQEQPPATLSLRGRAPLPATMVGCNSVYFARVSNVSPAVIAGMFAIDYQESATSFTENDLRGDLQAIEVRAYRG